MRIYLSITIVINQARKKYIGVWQVKWIFNSVEVSLTCQKGRGRKGGKRGLVTMRTASRSRGMQ